MPRAAPVTIAIFISSISTGYIGRLAIAERISFDQDQL
jgi:hypothetical protein